MLTHAKGHIKREKFSHWNAAGRPKLFFADKASAQVYADKLNDEDIANDRARLTKAVPYRCGTCDGYHVGNPSPRGDW